MTNRRTQRDAGPDAGTKAKAAAVREAKGSVQEAIGKLIGDDAAEARGSAEKRAAAEDARNAAPPRR